MAKKSSKTTNANICKNVINDTGGDVTVTPEMMPDMPIPKGGIVCKKRK